MADTSAQTPTASGISCLLAAAGFTRAVIGRFTVINGFQVTKDLRRNGTVKVGYAAIVTAKSFCIGREMLAAYAETIRKAGWTVEATDYELIVTAKAEEA